MNHQMFLKDNSLLKDMEMLLPHPIKGFTDKVCNQAVIYHLQIWYITEEVLNLMEWILTLKGQKEDKVEHFK